MPLFRGTFFLKSAVLSVSVFKICAELYVPFEETCRIIGTVLEKYCENFRGRFSIGKMNVQLEIKA